MEYRLLNRAFDRLVNQLGNWRRYHEDEFPGQTRINMIPLHYRLERTGANLVNDAFDRSIKEGMTRIRRLVSRENPDYQELESLYGLYRQTLTWSGSKYINSDEYNRTLSSLQKEKSNICERSGLTDLP